MLPGEPGQLAADAAVLAVMLSGPAGVGQAAGFAHCPRGAVRKRDTSSQEYAVVPVDGANKRAGSRTRKPVR